MTRKSVKTRATSVLRMPGFNAEASLYTSLATYRSSGGSDGRIEAVQPAAHFCNLRCLAPCERFCGESIACKNRCLIECGCPPIR